ncbi:TPA: hypothetical protein ACIJ20_005745 [Pseudomonas aeruginosa]
MTPLERALIAQARAAQVLGNSGMKNSCNLLGSYPVDVKLDSYVVDFEYKVLAGTQEYLGKSRAAFPAAVVPVSLSDEGARKRIAEIINGKMIEILPQVIADNNIDVDSISGRVSFNVGNLKTTRVSTVVSLG